ncbi:4'-phosphopantetheinyl transferase superfamily protein [Leifsonia sp. NPDC077715]|uniref:4'-phosphopantetheinyl transferase superfamily protein n=1 Tax=Leifsonia sp. NPDC077715 TaxID=3155539 RepID=UPI00343750E9
MPAFVVLPYAADLGDILSRLSDGDRARLDGLRGDTARRRFLAGRAALLAAAARAGEPGILIDARCRDCGLSHGRPTAQGASRTLHLALAHAGGNAFAAASDRPVGIDSERADTPTERRAAIDALAPGRGDPLRRWTAIEAVLKADGRGLRVAPDAVRLRHGNAALDGARYRLRSLRAPGFVVMLAEQR